MQVFHNNSDFASNINDIRQYTLGDPRVICRILSDNLYSNKIGSIVREISANALDAHRMTGKENVPFDVVMPYQNGLFKPENEMFSVRDYGPGLSEDDIYNLYTSYGSSSKRSDNSQIGGFGIGSKSPFAYSENFVVTSWNNGIVSKYLCFLNEENSPCIKKIYSTESSEPSGIMVEIPVKSKDDADLFTTECNSQYCFYDVIPNGGYWKKPDIKYENEYGTLYDLSWFASAKTRWGGWHNANTLHGKVNNSVYKLCWDDSSDKRDEYGMQNGHLRQNCIPFNNVFCVLKISGSNVDLSASREELAFTDRTKQEIAMKWKAFIRKAWLDIIDSLNRDTEMSRFEAGMTLMKKEMNLSAMKFFLQNDRSVSLKSLDDFNLSIDELRIIPSIIVDGSFIAKTSEDVRIYESNKSAMTGNPVLVKIIKKDAKNDKGYTIGSKNFAGVKSENGIPWSLLLNRYSNFYLLFVNREATFESIKQEVKKLYASMKQSNLVLHIYATLDENDIKRIVEAYGNPDEKRILRMTIKKSKKTLPVEVIEKKEKVKVRVNDNLYDGRRYSLYKTFGTEILYTIRSNIVEKWLTCDEIESMMKEEYAVLITNGTEVSTKWTDNQEVLLNAAGRFCVFSAKIPNKWILINEASYSKLLSLGFKPLGNEYIVSFLKKIFSNIKIDFIDFIKWSLISKHSQSHFNRLVDYYKFEETIASRHLEHPVVKAFLLWKEVQHKLSSNASQTSYFEHMLNESSLEMVCANEIAAAKEAVNCGMIDEWIKNNPILSIIKHSYGDENEERRNGEILEKYIVWN